MMALTIRTTESQDELIAKLCKQLDIKTASKLFIYLLGTHESREEHVEELYAEINHLEHDLKESVNVILNYQQSFSGLMSHTTKNFDSELYKEDIS